MDFIDPLFAVALSLNFEEIKKEPWFGHISQAWYTPDSKFVVATILLAYATVILSWVGYHRSIKAHPIKLRTLSGWGRFILDVALLILYFILLVGYANFGRELHLLAVIYFVFILWDLFKMREHPRETYNDDQAWLRAVAQRGVTVFWFVVFLGAAVFYRLQPPKVRFDYEDWILWLLAISATFLYRIHKVKLWFKPLLIALGYKYAE